MSLVKSESKWYRAETKAFPILCTLRLPMAIGEQGWRLRGAGARWAWSSSEHTHTHTHLTQTLASSASKFV